jgi:hypothetical protein
VCMDIHDNIIERHICTSEWAVSNLLPSNGVGPRIPSGNAYKVDSRRLRELSGCSLYNTVQLYFTLVH